ncbi:MAG: hypothetical protein JW702_04625 [Clostridiales bacterium]|nr:hypothetical protein [Clostridiales bacterium]
MRKNIVYIVILVTVIIAIFTLSSDEEDEAMILENAQETMRERINYKLTDSNGQSSVINEITSSDLEIHLKISPYISTSKKAAYLIFMNGKQIACRWDDVLSIVHKKEIQPNVDESIKITLSNIPMGVSTFHIGVVYFPDKLDFTEEDILFSQETMLNLKSFTAIRGESTSKEVFVRNDKYINEMEVYTTENGDFSKYYDEILITTKNEYSKNSKIYYHWTNNYETTKNMRFSLLVDWKQIEWPNTNDLFIDTSINPGESITIRLDLEKFSNNGEQLVVVSFQNPGISFWYYDENDKNNSIKASGEGALAFSTYRLFLNE